MKSVVQQLTSDGSTEPNNQDLEDSNPEPKIWDTEDYISYFRIGFDLEGSLTEYSIIGVDAYNGFEGYGKPGTGLNLGYEYASPNGFGFGLDFQFFRSFDIEESDFRYTSIYGIWNSTFSNGFSLFSKAGYSLFSKEGFDTVNYAGFDPLSEEEIDYFESQFTFDTGVYFSVGFRRPISDSMHLECGFSVNTVSQKLRSEHTYSRPYVGLSFLF